MTTGVRRRRMMPVAGRLEIHLLLGLLSCHRGAAFIPTSGRLSTYNRHNTGRLGSRCTMTNNPHHTEGATSSYFSRTAAACLATATILSVSIPTDASALIGSPQGYLGRDGAPTTLVMTEATDSADGRADVSGLVSELRGADKADSVLNVMIKINDMVDADDEGVVENPFAKESIVKGLIQKRKSAGEAWNGDTETAFGILKRKLDPFNIVLLRPYLKIAPFLGGAYYLAVFFVQQKFRGFFAYAYFGAVAVFVAPAIIIVLTN